jgi:hypothetical protein
LQLQLKPLDSRELDKMSIEEVFKHEAGCEIPWGEFWISSAVFQELNLRDDLESHLELCRRYEMDFLSLPIRSSGTPSCNYRFFDNQDITRAKQENPFILAVLDGPFQNLASKFGVFSTLTNLSRNLNAALPELNGVMEKINQLAGECLASGANALLIADDIASSRNTYFSPALFNQLFYPLYIQLIEQIHSQGALAIFHSDGNITSIIPVLLASGFDGINCQQECVDLSVLKKAKEFSPVLFTSLDSASLDSPTIPLSRIEAFSNKNLDFRNNGRLVLSSCSGLNSLNSLCNRQNLRKFIKGL